MDNGSRANQLRLDKIIFATEASATNLACILVFLLGDKYFVGATRDVMMLGSVLVGLSYTIYMGMGNLIRWGKIKNLEREL